MRRLTGLFLLSLALLLGTGAVRAQAPAAPGEPRTVDLIEDLRLLSLVNALEPTRDQTTKLAAVAGTAKEGLAAIDAEVDTKLEPQRPRLSAEKTKVLRGGGISPTTEARFTETSDFVDRLRAQKTELLIQSLTVRVRKILTAEQERRIEEELAPSFNQPWRRYARMLNGPAGTGKSGRMPVDPGWWLNELRDLRVDSAEGDPKVEIVDFGKKFTRGLPAGSPLAGAAAGRARSFATQVLAMPPDAFRQREGELARLTAKQELGARNEQNRLDGKPVETFDPARWLVEQVLLSPRAEVDLRERR